MYTLYICNMESWYFWVKEDRLCIQNNLHSFDVQFWCAMCGGASPLSLQQFYLYMCCLSVVQVSLNQRHYKSDGTSGIPLCYLYYPIILPPDIAWGFNPGFMNHPCKHWLLKPIKVGDFRLQQDSAERCENGGVLWFGWYFMASSSSHRRGRLFGIQKWKNLGGFHVTLHNDTHCRRLGYALSKITHCNWERLENESFLHV